MEQNEKDTKWFFKLALISLFVVSMSCLGLEILLTRIFSVVLFASHSFMAISLTLLGTGSGAIVAYLGVKLAGHKARRRLIIVVILMAASVTVSSFSLLQVEFVPMELVDPETGRLKKDLSFRQRRGMIWDHPELFDMWKLYGIIPIAFLPFFFAGYIQAFIFRSFPKRFPMLYGLDLFGATLGSIVMPLLLYPLGLVGTLGAIVLVTLAPALYALATKMRSRKMALACATPLLIFMVLFLSGQYRVKYAAGFKEREIIREHWSPMARVVLRKWGQNDMYVIDNGSRSFYVPRTEEKVRGYDTSLYAVPFEMKAGGSVLIIASGGGQEVTMASHYGFEHIDAVEIARPIITDILDNYADDPGNPYLLPNVKYYVADGRSVAMRSRRKYDVIEMLEVNFHTIAGQISQAWSPYLVFTQEAFAEYLDHLNEDGYLCYTIFTRGRNPVTGNKGKRFRSIIAGMRLAGIEYPQNHLVIMTRPYVYGNRVMVMAKKSEFTVRELVEIRELLARRGPKHEIIYPDMREVARYADIRLPEDYRLQRTRRYIGPVDTTIRKTRPFKGAQANIMRTDTLSHDFPINDNRPYMTGSGLFGNKKNDPAERLISSLYRNLFVIMGVLAAIFIVLPFIVSKPGGGQRVRIDPRLFFILVFTGVGFMFLEMAGIYKFQLYLHHPTWAMIIVLSSMIMGAGLGSIHSGRTKQDDRRISILNHSMGAVAAGIFVLMIVPIYCHKLLLGLPFVLLAIIIFLLFCGFGFILGHIVPLSISTYAGDQSNLLCWCWAITVTGGVFGTVMASIVSRDFGIFVVALIGTALYMAVVLVGVMGVIIKPKQAEAAKD